MSTNKSLDARRPDAVVKFVPPEFDEDNADIDWIGFIALIIGNYLNDFFFFFFFFFIFNFVFELVLILFCFLMRINILVLIYII